MKITFFAYGSNAAFENGEQHPVAQKPWLLVFAEYLASQGIDPAAQQYVMPNGDRVRVFAFTDDDGQVRYNWE